MQGKINIYLTIDLECRRDSNNYYGPIFGRLSGVDKSFGLDFILNTLSKFGLKATFFVEPFFSYKFGRRALMDACERILSLNHDIQLHMHPYFKSDRDKLLEDKLYAYSYEGQVSLIQDAKEALLKCGVPKIVAFRAGTFAVNSVTYQALRAVDIKISSNYNLVFLGETYKIDTPIKYNDLFYYDSHILEMPITCFYEYNFLKLNKIVRHMQIAAVSFPEMEYIIKNAQGFNIKNIVILLHTFEFINFSEEDNFGKFDYINIRRFLSLCELLSNNRKNIEVKKISEVDIQGARKFTGGDADIPSMPLRLSFLCKLEQLKKRIR